MMNQIKSLFQILPEFPFHYYTEILIVSIILILSAIVFSFIYKKKKKSDIAFKRQFKNLSKTANTYGIILLILIGLRYEGIPFFAMRIWMYITGVLFIYTFGKYIYIAVKIYPFEKAKIEKKIQHSKNKKHQKKYVTKK